jgi:hypothetical protein
MVLRVRRSEASAGMQSARPIRAAANTVGRQHLVKQYRNITMKSIFQGSIGFICETPLFHKTRPRGAAVKRREGRNSGPRRAGLRLWGQGGAGGQSGLLPGGPGRQAARTCRRSRIFPRTLMTTSSMGMVAPARFKPF